MPLKKIVFKSGVDRENTRYANEGGSSVDQLVDLRNAIKAGFENLDQSKIPSDLAEQINAQYKIANNMYKNGFENNGQFFKGIDLYQSAMGKQSMGVYSTKYRHRFDTFSHILNYPQKPIVTTRYKKYTDIDKLPYGVNAIVAFASYT